MSTDNDEDVMQMMAVWYWATGTTEDDFIAEVERLQSGDEFADFMGIHAELAGRVFDTGLHPTWALHIIRAMQHLAITRPWRRKSMKYATKPPSNAPQLALF